MVGVHIPLLICLLMEYNRFYAKFGLEIMIILVLHRCYYY